MILTFNNSDGAVTFGQLATYAGARAHAADIEAALNPAELAEWHTALTQAEAKGTFFIALPFHCAVGTKG